MLSAILNPGEPVEITDAQAEQLQGHPWITVSSGTTAGATANPQPAPAVPSANQPPQTAVSDEPAVNESEAQ